MGDSATVKGDGGQNQNFGFSVLDIVKHSVSTIIEILGDDDHFSLVTFTDVASVVLDLVQMNAEGKKNAKEKLEKLKPLKTTNIWDGLVKGLDVLSRGSNQKPSHILLLTDGVPNRSPEGGEGPALNNFLQANPSALRYTINTFGFGYNLDSPLLRNLAGQTKGQFVFIPDSALVGTVFVHAISNLLCTLATNAVINVAVENAILTDSEENQFTSPHQFVVGSVLHGQARSLPLTVTFPNPVHDDARSFVNVSAQFYVPGQDIAKTIASSEIEVVTTQRSISALINRATELRARLPVVLLRALERVGDNKDSNTVIQQVVNPFITEVEALIRQTEEYLENNDDDDKGTVANTRNQLHGLLTDVRGEGCLALNPTNFGRWGKHYIPSLALAHNYQIRNNFKDPGVQFYGGDLFNQVKTMAEDIFMKLPPPTPSKRTTAGASANAAGTGVQSMQNHFYNSANPCFAGTCLVSLADGSSKELFKVQRGDRILTSTVNQTKATVTCLVETIIPEGQGVALVNLPGSKLRVTPWHPVRIDGEWRFPADVAHQAGDTPRVELDCRAVFSLVLDAHHVAVIDGVECVCLGHGLTDNTVVTHEYLGTERVLQDLSRAPGWMDGHVLLSGVRRDESTGRICGLAL